MPKQVLNRDDILRSAIELLDLDGYDQLSLRKLATRLGSGATSVYWHVKNKEELLSLVINEVLGEIELPDPEKTTWRRGAERFTRSLREVLNQHPWLSAAMRNDLSMGPNAARMLDRLLAILELGGFSGEEADRAAGTLIWYVMGVSGSDASTREFYRRHHDARQLMIDLSIAQRPVVEPYPRLLERYDAGLAELQTGTGDADDDPDDEPFEYGLETILDGLESRRRRRRTRSRS